MIFLLNYLYAFQKKKKEFYFLFFLHFIFKLKYQRKKQLCEIFGKNDLIKF